MADRVNIGGIKLSEELVQIDFQEPGPTAALAAALLHQISTAKISIPHLHQNLSDGAIQTTICLAVQDYFLFQHSCRAALQGCRTSILPSTGTITLFPHGSILAFAALIYQVFSEKKLAVHSFSTSISALVIHTDYSLLEVAVEAILEVCKLPDNHTPFRPKIVLDGEVVETIAVYWEEKIRIYGINTQPGCRLFRIHCRPGASGGLAIVLKKISSVVKRFTLCIIQMQPDGGLQLNLLLDQGDVAPDDVLIAEACSDGECLLTGTDDNVALVSFYGPHFQDRYGIADAAYSAFVAKGFTLPASSCTGTSVQFVIEEKKSRSLVDCLSCNFIVPR